MMMRCPVIRWQGERRKRQGLLGDSWQAAFVGVVVGCYAASCRASKSRCHATRQRLRTVARSVVGIAAGCLS